MYPCVRAEVLACIIAAVGVAGRDAVMTATTASDPGVHCIPQRWLHQTLQERLRRACLDPREMRQGAAEQ